MIQAPALRALPSSGSDLDDIRNDILRCRAALAANLKQPASKAGSQKQRGRENRTRLQERKQLECTLDNLLAARSAKWAPSRAWKCCRCCQTILL